MVHRGEIYWCDLGEQEGCVIGKERPVLIVQNDKGNSSSPTTIVAAITSQPKKSYPFHVNLKGADCGLKKDGAILLEQLQTLDIDDLGDYAGRVPAPLMLQVDKALHLSLALN